jgi:hypothetical protein
MLSKYLRKYSLLLYLVVSLSDCKKAYQPPAIIMGNNFLVVDGVINISENGVTTMKINRTRNLGDTVQTYITELHATVQIIGSDGTTYPLADTSNSGIYISDPITLNIHQKYGLEITTSDGKKYVSDLVPGKVTPLMDSVYWRQPDDLTFYVDTHDATNSTQYYRWDFVETWAHDATLPTPWVVENGLIIPANEDHQTTNCWTTQASTGILLGTSVTLSEDVIRNMELIKIPNGDPKVDKRYSLYVRQYALTVEAYNYWSLIQKTSQQLGSLFDLQPAQLIGNIHSLSNPDEPVIGFISASTVPDKRIFLYNTNLTDWGHHPVGYSCDTLSIPVNRTDYRIYNYPDTIYAPYYFISNGPLVLATRVCLDCRLLGGTNIKPSFW